MAEKYIVRLSAEEREELTALVSKGQSSAARIRHAQVLLKADADGPHWADPRIAEAVRELDITYVITSTPVVRGFVMPDGLVSLDKSTAWAKIYDNGVARIYQWRGSPPRDAQ